MLAMAHTSDRPRKKGNGAPSSAAISAGVTTYFFGSFVVHEIDHVVLLWAWLTIGALLMAHLITKKKH